MKSKRGFDVSEIRKDFPILSTAYNNKPLIYFDNGATTQKPLQVIERISEYYRNENANVHRGVYRLSAEATESFEFAREVVREFINANNSSEIIFTRGTTESINLVATILCRAGLLKKGSEIIISEMEHHSNIVSWQVACPDVKIKVLPFDDNGELKIEELENLISEKTVLLSVVHISNTLGTINNIKEIIDIAKKHNLLTLIDGAQAVSHLKVDVQNLGCDFYAFSGHKIFAPTGIGVLYGREEVLNMLPPFHGGGEMIDEVTFEKSTFNELPYKFEAGTPNISGALALAVAIKYFASLDLESLTSYENELTEYALNNFPEIHGLKVLGNAKNRVPIFSFVVDGVHHYDIGTMLDANNIALRTGHHCTQPTMKHFNVTGTTRISLSFYNTLEELNIFFTKLKLVLKILR